jgi:peptide chain release factor subunit 1
MVVSARVAAETPPPLSIHEELRKLAALKANLPIVSLYLNARGRDQHEREAARTFVRQAFAGAARSWRGIAGAESLEADLAALKRLVSDLFAPRSGRAPGLAVFACSAARLLVVLPAPVPFRNQFGVGRIPLLAQLSMLADEYEPALVALVDAASARFFTSTLGGLLSELQLFSNVPGWHKQGGWSQARYQRHILTRRDEHHQAVAGLLEAETSERAIPHIVLGGMRLARANVRRLLSAPAAERIVGEFDLPVRAGLSRVEEAVRSALQAWERRCEAAALAALSDRAGDPALAGLGLDNTLAAANRRAVHLLVVSEQFVADGWACEECGGLQAVTTLGCERCGGKLGTADLREALVAAVLRAGGQVEWVAGSPPVLQQIGGVGALLHTPHESH